MRQFFSKQRKSRGSTLILLSMVLPVFLIPLVGLAIDGTMLFIVQTKLSSAVDGAALGTGRLVGVNPDSTAVANEFITANFPAGFWGANHVNTSVTATDAQGMQTITINASAQVPLLFMRILGQSNATVSASAVASRRDVCMMIVVDRSGSVVEEQANGTIVNVLNQFVADSSSSSFVDGLDEIGMVSFGGTWKLDFAPTVYFQSGNPNIGTAINNIPFTLSNGNSAGSGTNTAEGLYQAWYQLRNINNPNALNVILLLTDGRPTAFTGTLTSTAHCTSTSHPGVIQGSINAGGNGSYPWWPPYTPPKTGYVMGMEGQQYQGVPESGYTTTTNPTGCSYASGQSNVPSDIPTIPNNAGPIDNVGSISTYTAAGVPTQTQGYYIGFGNSTNNLKSIRYAAFNVADNIATLIRQDTVIKPVIFVIGLYYTNDLTEPLDSDWLARVANDQSYTIQNSDADANTTAGSPVFQSGQTPGYYYESNSTGLGPAFSNITAQVFRLSQ